MKSVPPDILARLRSLCLSLPEAQEERAWVGTRWCIRKKNFAHVLMIEGGRPPAYARAAGMDGPVCVMTFRSPLPTLDAYAYTWEPFFRPVWFPDIVGLKLDGSTDWDEVAELVSASYRHLVPTRLAAQIGSTGP
jgi:hypothetical protein